MNGNEKSKRLKAYLEQVAPGSFDRGSTSAGMLEEASVSLPGMNVAIDRLATDKELTPSESVSIEAIIHKKHRPAVFVVNNTFEDPPDPWQHFGDANNRKNIEKNIPSIGRVELPPGSGIAFGGTAFVVGEGLVMTNRHVAEKFASGLGIRNLKFRVHWSAGINFRKEVVPTPDVSDLVVSRIEMIHPYWDMALLRVEGLSADQIPLDISVSDLDNRIGKDIAVIGYPAQDSRNSIDVQNEIFGGVYNVKRLQPGKLQPRKNIESYQQNVHASTHDASTLGGNSGSAVIDVETGAVIALHFAGRYLDANFCIPTFELARDSRVVNAGVNFRDGIQLTDQWSHRWSFADQIAALDSEQAVIPPGTQSTNAVTDDTSSGIQNLDASTAETSGVSFVVPLNITISVGDEGLVVVDGASTSAANPTAEQNFTSNNESINLSGQDIQFKAYNRSNAAALSAESFSTEAALTCAAASALVYSDNSAEIRSVCLENLGFANCQFYKADATECFVAEVPNTTLIVFRGTQEIADWVANLSLFREEIDSGMIHSGFLRSFQDIRLQIENHLDRNASPEKSLVIAGHSLGGAIATIALAQWSNKYSIRSVYTYGQPAVGDDDFRNNMAVAAEKMFRVVNNNDIATRLPPGYTHVGHRKMLPPLHELRSLSSESIATAGFADLQEERMMDELEFYRFQQSISSVHTMSSTEGGFPSFADHKIINYLQKLLLLANPA